MMRALVVKGHRLSAAMMGDMYIEQGVVKIRAAGIELIDGADSHGHAWWSQPSPAEDIRLADFDAVIMRKDPPFDMEYVYATHLFDYAQAQGARVFNSGTAIRNHPEKLAITEFSKYSAPTLVTSDMQRLRAFHAEHQDVIVKPLDGMGGAGIFRMRSVEPNMGAILETLTENGSRTRSEEHTSELQSLMRTSYAVF